MDFSLILCGEKNFYRTAIICITSNKYTVMNSSFLYLLGDCINTIACVRNTKVIQLSYVLKVNKLRNAVPSAVIPIAESTDKCKNKQSFWSTRLLMIQTFVFVRYLDSFSAVPPPSF